MRHICIYICIETEREREREREEDRQGERARKRDIKNKIEDANQWECARECVTVTASDNERDKKKGDERVWKREGEQKKEILQ